MNNRRSGLFEQARQRCGGARQGAARRTEPRMSMPNAAKVSEWPNARYSADEVDCPVPNKSVRCQSIWPVHVPLPAIPVRSVSVGASTTSPAAMTLCTSRPVDTSIRAKPRRGSATTGPNQPARSPLDRRRGPTWTTICTLIVCHSIRPAQVKANLGGPTYLARDSELCCGATWFSPVIGGDDRLPRLGCPGSRRGGAAGLPDVPR